MPEALGQVVLSARWTQGLNQLGAGATEGTRVSNDLGMLALQFWGFQGKQLLWEGPQGTQVMLEISTHSQHHPPVLQWALRAAVQTSPGVWEHYSMESHELLRRHQADYSCTGFQTT